MDDQRKKIVIKEIENWKENHLLPEHYCNFLLTLYSEGSHPISKNEAKKQEKLKFNQFTLFLLAIAFVFVIYFTELSFILQIGFYVTFFIIGCFLIYYFFKIGTLPHLSFILTAFVLLLGSIEFISHNYPNNSLLLYIGLFINCLLWLITGLKLKLNYLTISGILGLLTIIIFIFI